MPPSSPTPSPSSLLHRFASLPADTPMPLLERRRIIGAQAMISHITLRKGCNVPMHAHENEQFAIVLTGRLRFTLGHPGAEQTLTVSAGEVLHLPGNLPHAAFAEEDSIVLDVFSPPSTMTGIDRKS